MPRATMPCRSRAAPVSYTHLKKGDVIATLDTTDVEKQIANAELKLSDTQTDAQKSYDQAVEDQATDLASARADLEEAQKKYDTLGLDDYYGSMADGSNSGKTNREIVTEYYTRYAEEIAGYENTLANLRIQLTQAQQDGDADRAAGLQLSLIHIFFFVVRSARCCVHAGKTFTLFAKLFTKI